MTREDMMKAMENAGCDGSSALHMRSESIQNRVRIPRIPTLKNALRKKSKLLVMTELAFPFNPETGEADGKFNSDNKYRPPMSSTSVALAMKDFANENESLKSTLMKRVGVEEWDTTDHETLTKEDWKIFAPYRVPKIFTVIATHINIPAMGTGKFGRDYAVTIERDKRTGEIIGDIPSFISVNKFFNDRAYEEIQEYEDKIARKEITQTQDQQTKFKQDVRSRCPVSDDRHINYVQIFEIPLDKKYMIDPALCAADAVDENVKNFEVVSRYKKGIRQVIESYQDGSLERIDKNFDFWEVDMTCPSSGDDTTMTGKAAIGRDTKFEKPTAIMHDADYGEGDGYYTDTITKAIRKHVDNDFNIEEKVRRSMMISVFDETVEQQMYRSLSTVIDLKNDRFITKKVIQNNAEFITMAFGEEGDELLESIEAGVEERDEGQLDESESKKTAKDYDLNSDDFNPSELDEMDDFDNVDLTTE